MDQIKKLSRILKFIFTTGACALPLIYAGYWISDGYPFLKPWIDLNLVPTIPAAKPLGEMSPLIKLSGYFVSMLPTAINMIALGYVAKLFHLFSQMQIFTEETVKCIRKVGKLLLFNQLLFPFYMGLLSLVLTISNPPGHRLIQVAFGTEQIALLIIATIILLTSWVMDEGRKLQEEQAGTI